MKKNKRLILCGPSASGKTFIREKLEKAGYISDVSYTSRNKRNGEEDGVHYNFVSKKEFEDKIENKEFYEYVQYDENYYGTGLKEFNESDIFIFETDGIKHLKENDRKKSVVIYVNTPENIRVRRMLEREWNLLKINERLETDRKKFEDFIDFDLEIKSY